MIYGNLEFSNGSSQGMHDHALVEVPPILMLDLIISYMDCPNISSGVRTVGTEQVSTIA